MRKGFKTIVFRGGCYDGESVELPLLGIQPVISVPHSWTGLSGRPIALFDVDWDGRTDDFYALSLNPEWSEGSPKRVRKYAQDVDGSLCAVFRESVRVSRCMAMNKSNRHRCRNDALEDFLCNVHLKAADVAVFDVSLCRSKDTGKAFFRLSPPE